MQIGRVEAGATAPTTAWPPSVAETSEDTWEEYGAINAIGSQQCWTCKGYGHVSWDCPNGKGKGKGKDNFGKGKGAYGWGMSNHDGNKGSNYRMYKGGGKANSPGSHGPVKGYQKGDGKSGGKGPVVASATLAVEIMHEIAPKVEEKGDSGHWKPRRLGKRSHWWNAHVFCHRHERHHPSMQVYSECREI